MPTHSNIVYYYDGTFEGLLCCVFESYYKNEIPSEILPADDIQLTLLPVKEIVTNYQNSDRVLISIPKKMGNEALEFIKHAFLTCISKKELYIVLFLRLGFKNGPLIMDMLSNDVVNTLFKAVNHLTHEAHLLTGFIRFSIYNNALYAEIEPKNFVLPLLTNHFIERYPEEQFLIHDKTHNMALIYKPYKHIIIPIESIDLPVPDEDEKHFRQLWSLYYNTVAIKGRYNPKCRISHMPKRYWKYLTEFSYVKGNHDTSLI